MGRASERRIARVSTLLQETLAEVIREELNDPRLGLWTLTGIHVSPDLAHARVTVSTLAGGAGTEAAVAALNRAAPLLWNRVRSQTDLRQIPQLRFVVDRAGEYQDEIASLLQALPPPFETDDEAESDTAANAEAVSDAAAKDEA